MPDLNYQISSVEPGNNGLTPLLNFKVAITTTKETDRIRAALLHAQIQLQPPGRAYNPSEKEKLTDLFGAPERWGQTLRNRLWTHAETTVGYFTHRTTASLEVPCSYDLNLAATKYFFALEDGIVPLLFLFSGSIFYEDEKGQLKVEPISWDKECAYQIPVRLWRDLMEQHYPNSAWLYLQRSVFERLYAYKRRRGLPTWEQAIESLLPQEDIRSIDVPRVQEVVA